MTKFLAALAAIAVGFFAGDSYLTIRAAVKTLTADNAILHKQIAATAKQHNTEGAIGQRGLSYDRQGTAQQEKTQSEIRQQVEREPCTKSAVPAGSAERLWQLTERTRAATVPDAARKSDSVAPAAAPGR